jgi:hypothetical protein
MQNSQNIWIQFLNAWDKLIALAFWENKLVNFSIATWK